MIVIVVLSVVMAGVIIVVLVAVKSCIVNGSIISTNCSSNNKWPH